VGLDINNILMTGIARCRENVIINEKILGEKNALYKI